MVISLCVAAFALTVTAFASASEGVVAEGKSITVEESTGMVVTESSNLKANDAPKKVETITALKGVDIFINHLMLI